MLAEGEWKKVIGIVGICAIASLITRRRQKVLDERDAIENGLPVRERSIWEHPFIAYLIENTLIISTTLIGSKIPLIGNDPNNNQIVNTWRLFLRTFVMIEGGLAIQEFVLLRGLYSNVPWFCESKRPKSTTFEIICDWLQCNFPATMITASAPVLALTYRSDIWTDLSNSNKSRPIYVIPFLIRLAFSRIVSDITFHVVHRWLHDRSVYKMLHSRHHEHNKCSLITNFHLTWMDLYLEAALPVLIAFGLLGALGKEGGALETVLIGNYISFFETASHSGKEIPYATIYPPLTPLINAFTDTDRDNIKYHETHHNLVRCNYGITQWVDMLVGTHRLQKQPCELGVKEIPIKEIPDEYEQQHDNQVSN